MEEYLIDPNTPVLIHLPLAHLPWSKKAQLSWVFGTFAPQNDTFALVENDTLGPDTYICTLFMQQRFVIHLIFI